MFLNLRVDVLDVAYRRVGFVHLSIGTLINFVSTPSILDLVGKKVLNSSTARLPFVD